MWQADFYIVDSGIDNATAEESIITVPITADILENGYDLTQYIDKNSELYGGYAIVPAESKDDPSAIVEPADGKYDGDNWTWNVMASEEAGNKITPVAGSTYYIKVVPADKFLRPYTHYTFYIKDGTIGSLFAISDIDDLNYSETGFIITSADKAKVYRTLKIEAVNTGSVATLTPATTFASRNVTNDDFLTCLDVTGNIKENDSVKQYWITPDGATVTGIRTRTLTGITNRTTMQMITATFP